MSSSETTESILDKTTPLDPTSQRNKELYKRMRTGKADVEGLIYFASPFTHPKPEIQHQRWWKTIGATCELMRAGYHIYSPIVYGYALFSHAQQQQRQPLPGDNEFWGTINKSTLRASGLLLIHMLDGWENSTGIAEERVWAGDLNMKVMGAHPDYICEDWVPIV